MIPDGASLMIGGFMGVGTPERLIDELVRQGKRELTVIANDTAMPGVGIGKLVSARWCARRSSSHIGLNPETQRQMIAGEMEVELVPQGTLIERIRAGGYGLGGVLTPTGVGTVVEEGKRKIEVDGKEYLLETALRADFALVQAFLADYLGNLTYALTARNFNPIIAMAADTVIVDAEQHRAGRRDRAGSCDDAGTARRLPGRPRVTVMDAQAIIAKRIARELTPRHARQSRDRHPDAGREPRARRHACLLPVGERTDRHRPGARGGHGSAALTDAGGRPVTALPGASTFDSAMSFGLIRGGHLDMTVLGGLQVDEQGRLANWMIPGKMVPGMGGAMDLVSGAKRVVVAMQHCAKGKSKVLRRCTLPLTSTRRIDLLVTELAVIAFSDAGALLQETAPGIGVGDVVANTEANLIVPERVPSMAI